MKTIITGGSGSIGRKLTQTLTQHGHEVVILSRNPGSVSGLPKNARAVKWDARTSEGWLSEADGADAIVNLAGSNIAGTGFFPKRWNDETRKILIQSRVDAGKAVVEAIKMAKIKPKVVVQQSAIGYYGPRGDEIVTEENEPADDFLAHVQVATANSTKEVEDHGVRRVILRHGIYLDPTDGALYRLVLPFKMFVGGPMGSGKQWYSWIHPADTAGAIIFLIENETASGAYNLTAPNPERNKDFARKLGKALNRPSFMPLPGFVLKILFGEVSTVVLDGQRVVPKRLQEAGYEFKFPTLESALKDLLK